MKTHTDKKHPSFKRANYQAMHHLLETVLDEFRILSGDAVGPSDASWQDVAGTASVNLRVLASQLEKAREGNSEPFLVFPSPDDCTPIL